MQKQEPRSIIAIRRRLNFYRREELQIREREKKFGVRQPNKVIELNRQIDELEWVLGKDEYV